MQTFDRSDEPAPACLSDERTRDAREALLALFQQDERRQAQTRSAMARLAIQEPELDAALARLFRNRCAFCERKTETYAYRFRPTEEAGPRDHAPPKERSRAHLYYTWLTNAWQNLYSICDGCSPREPSFFPVRGSRVRLPTLEEVEAYAREPTGSWRGRIQEQPLLLDPCGRADLRKHLAFVPSGEVLGLSAGGDAVIAHHNLKRQDLTASRTNVLNRYFSDLIHGQRDDVSKVLDFKSLEHGGAWFLLLYQLAKRIGNSRAALSREKIASFIQRGLSRGDLRDVLRRGWEDLSRDPFQLLEKTPRATPIVPGAPLPIRFEIRNFKAIEHLDIDLSAAVGRSSMEGPLAPALVVLGENAAGKSSLLEAMTLALCDDAERQAVVSDPATFMLDPFMMGGDVSGPRREGSVELTFEDGTRSVMLFDQRGFRSETISASSPQAATGRVPVFAYGAYRLFLNERPPTGPARGVRSLFEAGRPLGNPDKWLYSIRNTPLFDEVVRALRSILSIGQAFDRIEADEQAERCLLVMRNDRPDGTPVLTRIPLALGPVSA